MKPIMINHVGQAGKRRTGEQAQTRIIILALVLFLTGVAVSSLWFSHELSAKAASPTGLSGTTKAVLRQLKSPVEIRYYSLLDTSSVPASVQAFAGRVDQLLSAYEQEAGGRIKVTRYTSRANSNAKSAATDGIKAFNIDKGDACFLGIATVQGARKESISYLDPHWEQALESEVTQALARSANVGPHPAAAPPIDLAALAAIKRSIPNVNSASLEEGTRILREAALIEFQQTARELQARQKKAEQTFIQGQNNQSDEQQQIATKQLKELQTEQVEKLKQIAANSRAQIETLQQLKGAAR